MAGFVRKGILAFSLTSMIHLVQAQETFHHGMFWGRLILSDRLTKKIKWELYLQKRTQNVPGEDVLPSAPHTSSIWFWLSYPVSPELKIYVSPFGYFKTHTLLRTPSDKEMPGINEYRWAIRLEHELKRKIVNYTNRYGIEYRRRDLFSNDVYLPNWRVRYQAKLEKPVFGLLSREKPVSFFLSDEVMLQFGEAAQNNLFDQNRLNAGASYEVLRNIKLSCSYLNIIQQRANGKDKDIANALWVILTIDNIFSQFNRSGKNDYTR